MKEELARKFSISDTQTIFISSFHTIDSFSKGFGIIYDSVKDSFQHKPKHWLAQNGLKSHVDRSTKASTSRAKKNRGIKIILAKPIKGIVEGDERSMLKLMLRDLEKKINSYLKAMTISKFWT